MRYTVEQFKKKLIEETQKLPRKRILPNFITEYYEKLPDFYRDNIVSEEQFQIYTKNIITFEQPIIKEVKIKNICGKAWLFQGLDAAAKIDNRPDKTKLENLLKGIINNANIPVIDMVYDLGNGKYLINDGCHRTYASYLLGKQTVTCNITGKYSKVLL